MVTDSRSILVCVLALVAALGAVHASAVEIVVDTFLDVNTGSCFDTECSLREAILYANVLSGSDTITLAPGTYQLSLLGTGDDLGYVGDLDITDDVNINGTFGAVTVISAAGIGDRVLHIHAGAFVSLGNLEVSGGRVGQTGGGILDEGQLSISSCVIRDNRSYDSHGGYRGGGIFVAPGAVLWLDRSTVTWNWSGASGGGLGIDAGASAAIYECSFSLNYGDSGGGARIEGYAFIRNSTFSGNMATQGGGLSVSGTVELEWLTFSGNVVATSGGAISSSGTVELEGTLIDGDCSGTGLASFGDNLESPGDTCGLDQASDLPNQPDPMLLPLAGYGGPTPTHALRPASPAVNQATSCVNVDQRNFPRPSVPECDIGAFELGAPPVGQWIFSDGFESGSFGAWSAATL